MRVRLIIMAISCCIVSHGSYADEGPGVGKLLVATDEVQGSTFYETVILLLHYDESGALGIVINRPTEAFPKDLLPQLEGIESYEGMVYWGGPVRLATMRALHRTDVPTENEIHVFDSVYRLPLNEGLPAAATNEKSLRFFIGYAGWSPGQLEKEILFGSWSIVPATEQSVFSEDSGTVWQSLSPPRHYRASIGQHTQTAGLNRERAGLGFE
jgi:putative transcriptional regulator